MPWTAPARRAAQSARQRNARARGYLPRSERPTFGKLGRPPIDKAARAIAYCKRLVAERGDTRLYNRLLDAPLRRQARVTFKEYRTYMPVVLRAVAAGTLDLL